MITSEELAEEVVVVRVERRANGGFGRGPGSADCGEPYWDPARGQPGGSREKSQDPQRSTLGTDRPGWTKRGPRAPGER